MGQRKGVGKTCLGDAVGGELSWNTRKANKKPTQKRINRLAPAWSSKTFASSGGLDRARDNRSGASNAATQPLNKQLSFIVVLCSAVKRSILPLLSVLVEFIG